MQPSSAAKQEQGTFAFFCGDNYCWWLIISEIYIQYSMIRISQSSEKVYANASSANAHGRRWRRGRFLFCFVTGTYGRHEDEAVFTKHSSIRYGLEDSVVRKKTVSAAREKGEGCSSFNSRLRLDVSRNNLDGA